MKNVAIEDILVHDRFVRRLARKLMGDAATADDATQEVYLRAMSHGPHDGGSLRGWLSRVLRNIGANIRRGRAHRGERERRASGGEACEPASAIVEREELRRRLVAAIMDLGTPRSTIVLLRYFEGVSPRVIAARLGMPVETVRTHLKRSLPLLRERLGSESRPDGSSLLMALPILLTGPSNLGTWMGVVMTAKTKVALASAVLLIATAAWVFVPRSDAVSDRPGAAQRGATASGPLAATGEDRAGPKLGTIAPRRFTGELSESSPSSSIEGSVVDGAGAPVALARVLAFDAGSTASIGLAGDATETRAASAVSDAAGRFKIPLEPPRRLLTLCATASGFSPALVTPVSFGARQTMTLERPIRIVGRTLDTSGKAVKDARVRWSAGPFWRETTSRDDGRFEIGDLPSGALGRAVLRGMILEARAEGFAPLAVSVEGMPSGGSSRQDAVTPGAVIEHDLILARGARVRGRLHDAENDAPIVGGALAFRSVVSSEAMRDGEGPHEERRAQSGDRGTYTFDQIPSRGFHQLESRYAGQPVGFIIAKPEGFAETEVQVPESSEGSVLAIDLGCWHVARVSGRVVNTAGEPQPDVKVWAYVRSLADVRVRPATTGTDGRFVLGAIPARSSEPTPVEIIASQAGADSLQLSGAGRREVNLRAGDDVVLEDFVLDPLPTIKLRVVDPSGLPIRGATARASWQGRSLPTGPDGRCTLPCRPDAVGQRRVVRIWASGFAPVSIEGLVPALTPTEVTAVMKPGYRLHGRAFWSDRSPAKGVAIALTEGRASVEIAANGIADGSPEEDYFKFYRSTTQSDGDGRFEYDGLPEPPYHVAAYVSPKGDSSQERLQPEVLLSNVRDAEIEIVLPSDPVTAAAQSAQGILEGTVSSAATGQLVTSFWASLSRPGAWLKADVPTIGRYRFEGLSPGKWLLRIESQGLVTCEREIEIGRSPTRFDAVLEEGLVIEGMVRTPKTVRLAEVRIFFPKAGTDSWITATIAADGHYRAAGFTPGQYPIEVSYPNAGQWDKALTTTPPLAVVLKAGSPPLHRDIDVVRGGWLNWVVPMDLLKAPGRAILRIVDASGQVAREFEQVFDAQSGGTGGALALPEGTYRVRLMAGATVIAEAEASVVDGTPATVNFP